MIPGIQRNFKTVKQSMSDIEKTDLIRENCEVSTRWEKNLIDEKLHTHKEIMTMYK